MVTGTLEASTTRLLGKVGWWSAWGATLCRFNSYFYCYAL